MTTYVLRRLLWMIPSLFVVFTLTFVVVHATPGSPWDESDKPLPEAVKVNLAHQYHLDDPLPKQYVDYLINALHGDLGPSYRSVELGLRDHRRDASGLGADRLGLDALRARRRRSARRAR